MKGIAMSEGNSDMGGARWEDLPTALTKARVAGRIRVEGGCVESRPVLNQGV